ncbi:hypothetical protein TL16_g09330 [Triparma laevis f. inornata]|uniref:Uncharacterized protein n=1 Tax=Triparma laevis f. inornata TaxID=1714386 RepID=A0A9W7B5W0_9STRA|nr:hypothetical protein TL16_g09330 [Triparma laevis f. inornata]
MKHETLDQRVSSYGFDVQKLMSRRATIISLLRSLQKSLEQNDQVSDGPKSLAEKRMWKQEAGIKRVVGKTEGVEAKLSHRGVQLAKEIHSKFSHESNDTALFTKYSTPPSSIPPKTMSFKEFRGYMASLGRPNELKDAMNNEESWCMFFDDLGGLVDGRITEEAMVKYRQQIEDEFDLEMDLLKLNMDVIPRDLKGWEKNKECFGRIDYEGVCIENAKLARRLGKKKAEKELVWEEGGKCEEDVFQLLVADCGEFYTYEQLMNMLFIMSKFFTVMAELRKRDGFLAWMMSRREREKVGQYEEWLIRAKMGVVRWMKEVGRVMGGVRKDVEALVDREILTPRILGGLKMDLSRYEGIFVVGDSEEVDEGMSARLNFSTLERAATAFAEMKLPRGCGTAVCIDLLTRSDVEPGELKSCVRKINTVLKEHFDKEISKLPLFHSWKVYSHRSDVDNIDVVRLALCFDRTASIDYALRELDMGFSFVDLLNEFQSEFRCSLNITDIFDSKRVTLEKNFHCQGNFVLGFARGLLVKILDEWILKFEEEKKFEDHLKAESDRMQADYDERTQTSHPVNPDFGRIRIGVDVTSDTKTGQQLETQRLAAEKARRAMWRFVKFLRGTKGSLVETNFKNIVDFLFGSKLIKSYLPSWLQSSFFTTQGSSTLAWRNYSKKLKAYMQSMVDEVFEQEEKLEKDQKEQERKEAEALGGMSELERRRKQLARDKKVLAHKLESLGIKMDPNLLKKEVKQLTPEEMRKDWKKKQFKSRMAFLKMYAAIQQACVGVNAVTVMSGTNKFELGLQGFDLFEVTPEIDMEVLEMLERKQREGGGGEDEDEDEDEEV